MARAKRHYIPNQIWHITQRCHKREFLLKFKRDRHRWIQWLFEAKRRFGLVVLNSFQKVGDGYWSSTTSVYEPSYAWVLYTKDGAIGVGFKSRPEFYACAVRRGLDGKTE